MRCMVVVLAAGYGWRRRAVGCVGDGDDGGSPFGSVRVVSIRVVWFVN